MNIDENNKNPTEDLADKIVALARSKEFQEADKREAVLLAQHRLFGSYYMNQLFIGRLNPDLLN